MVSIPTVCGILTTVGVGLVLRRVFALRSIALTSQEAFIVFIIYGLAFSLVASASRVLRKRDIIILILGAAFVWGMFTGRHAAGERERFLTFAALTTTGVLLGGWMASRSLPGVRILLGALLPGALCGVGGLVYFGLGGYPGTLAHGVERPLTAGLYWGFSLGFAVGAGVSVGSEVIEWIAGRLR